MWRSYQQRTTATTNDSTAAAAKTPQFTPKRPRSRGQLEKGSSFGTSSSGGGRGAGRGRGGRAGRYPSTSPSISIEEPPDDEDVRATREARVRSGDIAQLICNLTHFNGPPGGAKSAESVDDSSRRVRRSEGGNSPVPISKNLGTVSRDSQRPPTTINFVRKHRGSLPPKSSNSSSSGPSPPVVNNNSFSALSKQRPAVPTTLLLTTTQGGVPRGESQRLTTPSPKSSASPFPPSTAKPKSRSPSPRLSNKSPQMEGKSPPASSPVNASATKAVKQPSPSNPVSFQVANSAMFDPSVRSSRPAPEMPSTDGIEYPRAASWSSSTVAEILRDPLGRQVFRCFLYEALAEENLLFIEAIEQLKKEKVPAKLKAGIADVLDTYGSYINLSSVAMSKLRDASKSDAPDVKCLDLAYKEISKLLENDQYPRFRRSKIYLSFLEKLLPRVYAEKWTTSFDALLGNQVGRHYFRQYLFSVHAEENLRFWESVIEFRGLKNKSTAMVNMGRTIQQHFLKEGSTNEVFLPFGLRQRIDKKIRDKDVDETLFDDAVKHVEQILKNDPYVRFLQSTDYIDLLSRLR